MDEHVVRSATGDGVHRQGNRTWHLPVALKPRRIAGVDTEALSQPRRGDGADAVHNGVVARRRKQRTRGESVDLVDGQAGVRNGPSRDTQGDRAEWYSGVLDDVALRIPDDGHLIAGRKRRVHACSSSNAGTELPGPISSNATCTRLPIVSGVSASSRRRPMRRMSASPSSATSSKTSGSSFSKPGRNDWRSTIQERMVPPPLTDSKEYAGSG